MKTITNSVVVVQWIDHDSMCCHYLKAPEEITQQQFETYCNSLLPEAVEEAIALKGRSIGDEPDNWLFFIGWNNISEILANVVLPKYGYEVIKLPTACYIGPIIIRHSDDDSSITLTAESINKLRDYNLTVEQQLDNQRS